MKLMKNTYYDPNYTSGWIIKSYPFKVLINDEKNLIFNKESRYFSEKYRILSEQSFGSSPLDQPVLSLRNLPKNKIRFYFKSVEQFEKFKEIILILRITH